MKTLTRKFLLIPAWMMILPLTLLSRQAREITDIYRLPAGTRQGFELWIVDGNLVRREIYPQFLYGGNAQRYTFIPKNEIWIDDATGVEEFEYTVAHELRERDLMAKEGMTYEDAHDSALAVERTMRLEDIAASEKHETEIPLVSPASSDGSREIADLPDSIELRFVYRALLRRIDSISVWIVDGAAVRRDIYPDFGLSGNDLAYKFIPAREIWIDNQVSCEETEFSIQTEMKERSYILQGKSYDDAYEQAVTEVTRQRVALDAIARKKAGIKLTQPLEREKGTGDEGSQKP